MKKHFKQILVAVLLLASCHSTEPGWRDWFTPVGINNGWNNLKSWVATQWATVWAAFAGIKKPAESEKEIIITSQGITGSTFEAPPLPAPAPKQELLTAVNTFVEKLSIFASDLSQVQHQSATFQDLVKNNRKFLKNLDEISQLDLPEEILKKANAVNDPEILRNLASAFSLLQSDVPWHYLDLDNQGSQTLQQYSLPAHILPNFKSFINRYAQNVSEAERKQLQNYMRILDAHIGQKKSINLQPYQDLTMDKLLALLRAYKIQHMYQQLYNNRTTLRQGITDFYRRFYPQESMPDLTFLYYFA